MKYCIRDTESGALIDVCDSLQEAKSKIREYEDADREDGFYSDGAYEISEE